MHLSNVRLSWSSHLLRIFFPSAGVALFVTGAAKIVSAFGEEGILDTLDPVFGLSFRELMVFVGILEIIVAGLCFLPAHRRFTTPLLLWLAFSFFGYRTFLWYVGWQRPCGCLGTLSGALHLSENVANVLLKVVLGYLLAGSSFCFWYERKNTY